MFLLENSCWKAYHFFVFLQFRLFLALIFLPSWILRWSIQNLLISYFLNCIATILKEICYKPKYISWFFFNKKEPTSRCTCQSGTLVEIGPGKCTIIIHAVLEIFPHLSTVQTICYFKTYFWFQLRLESSLSQPHCTIEKTTKYSMSTSFCPCQILMTDVRIWVGYSTCPCPAGAGAAADGDFEDQRAAQRLLLPCI